MSPARFRYAPPDTREAVRETLHGRASHAVHASGERFRSHTQLGERYVLRPAVGNVRIARGHVARGELLRAPARAEATAP